MSAQPLELDDIQGNVLQGYGFTYAAYVSLELLETRDGRGLLAELRPRVTAATPWTAGKPTSALNIAVSHRGLKKLGVAKAVRASFPSEFRDGMARRADRLGDVGPSAPEHWEPGLRRKQLHVLVALQASSGQVLRERLVQLRARVAAYPGVELRGVHEARVRRSKAGWPREHFGFRDGFSQPAIRGAPGRRDPGQGVPIPVMDGGWRPLEPGEFILGYRDEDGGLPDAPVPPFARNGTFMVYRKLEQDVLAFRRLIRTVADEHFDGDRELVAAKLAGRWRDGSPLMLHPYIDEGSGPREVLNDFRYGGDPKGRSCPLGAHVRRANPRDGLPGGAERTRRHRIIRRGMPYGPVEYAGGHCGRGLIFVCFNASIVRQFEVVNGWLMDGDIFGLGRDPDILAGARAPGTTVRMTVQGDPPVLFESPTPLVRTRGGEYLFQPGLTTLETLADDSAIRP
jgi:Dyp-type peroxidase family